MSEQLELLGANWTDFEDQNPEIGGKEKPYKRTEQDWRWEWFNDQATPRKLAISWARELKLTSATVYYDPHRDQFTYGVSGWHVMLAIAFNGWGTVAIARPDGSWIDCDPEHDLILAEKYA